MSTAQSGVLGAAALAVENLDDLVVSSVREVHAAIGGRVFGVLSALTGRPALAGRIHQGIAEAAYGGIGAGLGGLAWALRTGDAAGWGPNIEDSASGRFVVAAVNGLIGDDLRQTHPRLSFELGLRRDGRHVPPTPQGLADVYRQASGSLAVFVHGLCETEDYWRRARRPRRPDQPDPTDHPERPKRTDSGSDSEPDAGWDVGADARSVGYGEYLEQQGWSALYVRANTGLGTAESGAALSALLARVVEHWPVEVQRIVLVGHSMGGLIIRRACAVDCAPGWVAKVSDVITLGTPHLGSPVERSIALGLRWADRIPELAPYRRIFSRRSAGVLELAAGIDDLPGLPHVRYRLVAATLAATTRHPVSTTIGDLLVQPSSALGLGRGAAPLFPGASHLVVPRADHFDLLNHDAVHAAVQEWLAEPIRCQ